MRFLAPLVLPRTAVYRQATFVQSVKSLLKLGVERLPAVSRLCLLTNGMKGLQISTLQKPLVQGINYLKTRASRTQANFLHGDELRLEILLFWQFLSASINSAITYSSPACHDTEKRNFPMAENYTTVSMSTKQTCPNRKH